MDTFPILYEYAERSRNPGWPATVPLRWIEGHREQVALNHHQSLERLAQRGGLSPQELYAAATGDRPDACDPSLPTSWYVGQVALMAGEPA